MPLSRRQVLRRRRIAVFGTFGLILAIGFYLPITLLAPLHANTATLASFEAPVAEAPTLTFPGYGATAIGAIGYPGVLASSGSTDPLPMASVSKVITALVVLEAKPLGVDEDGPDIGFTSKDVAIYNDYLARYGSVKPVKAGLVLTQREVMQLTLIASANNYAQSLVNWAFGSEQAFVEIANTWLATKGFEHTVMTDATGMNPENVSTSSDLIALGKLALANPLINSIVDTKAVTIPSVGDIKNTNKLLGDAGIRGIKTGTLDESNLLFAADYKVGGETITIIGVMLGAKNHTVLNQDVLSLLATVTPGFQEVVLTTKGTEYGEYATQWGAAAAAVAGEDRSVVVWGDTPIALFVEARPLTLAAKGAKIGTLTFTVGTATITVPLRISAAIEDPGVAWRLTHPADLF